MLLGMQLAKFRARCGFSQFYLQRFNTTAELPCPLVPAIAEKNEPELQQNPLASLQLKRPFKLHRLSEGPETTVTLSKTDAAGYYKELKTIRQLEAAASQLYREQIIRGFCHLYTGQEACAVGIKAAMRPQDNIIAAYRIHGWAYLMGITPLGVLAELTGKRSGCAKGKGGSMHMYAPHFYGGSGIVGAQVPMGAGLALASKYRQDGAVSFALYGDGAANQGQVFESFNMAQLWQLPLVFVCENNNYAMGTKAERASNNTRYYTRGDTLPGIWVNGMDVLAVRSAAQYAIEFALNRGPILLELDTYRYGGHSMSDSGTGYRSRNEIQQVRVENDAIKAFRELCLETDLLNTTELQQIDVLVRKLVEEAARVARSDVELDEEHLWTDVYAQNLEPKLRGIHCYDLKHGEARMKLLE